jgi:hypothetical protein
MLASLQRGVAGVLAVTSVPCHCAGMTGMSVELETT